MDKTVSKFSVTDDTFDLSPIQFTPRTRTRQGKTVLSSPYSRCEHTSHNSFVRPHMEFAIQAWSPIPITQNRHWMSGEGTTSGYYKLVKGFKKLCYEERLRKLNLTSLADRRLRCDLIETYKIITGMEKEKKGFLRLQWHRLQSTRTLLQVSYNMQSSWGSSQLLQSTCGGSLEPSTSPRRWSTYRQRLQEQLRLDEEWSTITANASTPDTYKYKYTSTSTSTSKY